MSMPMNVAPKEALRRLQDGNRRWVEGVRSVASMATSAQRAALADGQNPFAVILSCSDSRAPSEMLFDQGLGDLFVVRVAGNVIAPSLVGSIEYAVQSFGVGLVVVMGHTGCGAVSATLDAIQKPHVEGATESVLDIVQRIRPGIEPLTSRFQDRATLLAHATRENVRTSMRALAASSDLVSGRLRDQSLIVVGAEYSLSTGAVDFFDGASDHSASAA